MRGQIGQTGWVGWLGRVGRVGRVSWSSGVGWCCRVGIAMLAASYVVSGFSRTVNAQQPPPKPSFQSSVEVTSLDVSVVDSNGKPVAGLTPADFNVRVDGNARRVVTAEWIALSPAATEVPAVVPPDGYSTNESATGGRLIVIAV